MRRFLRPWLRLVCMRRLWPIDFAVAGWRVGMKRRAVGSSSGTMRRGPYEAFGFLGPRHQVVDVSSEVAVGQLREQVAQIGTGLDATRLAGADQAGEAGPVSAALVMARCPAGFWQGQNPERGRIGHCDGSWPGCGWRFRTVARQSIRSIDERGGWNRCRRGHLR